MVVGIIAILAGVLFASFGGASESARSAQCLTNLRALAMAANSYAVASNRYPIAGSVELNPVSSYKPQPGWINWLSQGKYEDGSSSASQQKIEQFPFYGTGQDEDRVYALETGALWTFCNRNEALYTCPAHVRYRREKQFSKPYFSYVMNARFGWDTTKGSGSIKSSALGFYYGAMGNADKLLMFAELPTVDVEQSSDEGGDEPTDLKADCVLQYKKMPNDGSGYASEDEQDAESIGFVHVDSRGKRCAHVAFADGHTETIVWMEGGLSPKDLTAYLCRGLDVVGNGTTGWAIPEGIDGADAAEEEEEKKDKLDDVEE